MTSLGEIAIWAEYMHRVICTEGLPIIPADGTPLYLCGKLINNCKHIEALKQCIIIKKEWQCKAGRGILTPYQSEDLSPTLPTYRGKEEKGKIVEDKKGESN